ncbi:SDR family oxidoreductase [Caldimonas thermodepolymerans]|uniref:NAD-dependent epimerase n=1 Tax=Caldimonas thermodepolymerans TaxID=215580 RepID=A0A2S5T884_9BURK|nr:D-erythronate dehydrogenase [Caldimonas thermodepolymerans]PPE71210.1 NAD-dependent epimerase [Caldimonas thermodepolymerans]QPC32385.1 SDR family oxidoreductase [Caldimonas thermodepolymerans]RDH98766.1 nucleoside-diphosphate-sugar epimerase [Caldimonas thermodepolymerans]
MRVLITGGAGFLGTRLARTLLQRGQLCGAPLARLVLADLGRPADDLCADARVQVRTGDLLAQLDALMAEPYDVVFHLAAAVSGECEADFDLGLRANLDTTRALLEACRRQAARGRVARFVFSSSVAVFGADPALPLPEVVDDRTLPTPQSSYGIQKFICEQLVADYTRKGYVDGRAARLMTVSVRPGRPNGAASGFLSGIVREPLAGLLAVCPVPPETRVALASPATTIAGLLAVAEASREDFGGRTALNLPALTVTVQQMLDALHAVGGDEARSLVRFERDPHIERIVGGWPARFSSARAAHLRLIPDGDFREVVLQYVRDHPQAVTNRQALRLAG